MKKVILSRPLRSNVGEGPGKKVPPPPSKEGEEGDLIFVPRPAKQKESRLDYVQSLADELSLADKKALYEHLALDLMASGSEGRDVEMWTQAVYNALAAAIGTQGGGLAGPLAIKRLVAARSAWAPVEGFMRDAGLDELQVAHRQACYVLLAKLLVARAREVARHAGIPLSAKLVASNAGDIAAIVDRSFPSYVASGLFAAVATRSFAGDAPDAD